MEKQDNGSFKLATDDPSYRVCLVDCKSIHSSPDHSCIYVNNKQGTVVTSCFSHRGGRIDKAREKRILNFFESIVLKRSSKETKKKPFVVLVEHMEDCAFENGYLRVQGTGEDYKRTNGLNYAYEKFKDVIDFINYLFMDDSLFFSCNNAMDRLKKWIMNDASSKFKFLQTDKSFIGFSNGVLNIESLEFIEVKNVPSSIVVRKYFDSKLDCQQLETPLFDKIMDTQFSDRQK